MVNYVRFKNSDKKAVGVLFETEPVEHVLSPT